MIINFNMIFNPLDPVHKNIVFMDSDENLITKQVKRH